MLTLKARRHELDPWNIQEKQNKQQQWGTVALVLGKQRYLGFAAQAYERATESSKVEEVNKGKKSDLPSGTRNT